MAEGIIDDVLIKAMQQGKPWALKQCYEQLSAQIYTGILKVCGDKPTAEDILHDTFIDIFNNVQGYKNSGSFAGWCKKIGYNNCINHLKRQGKLLSNQDNLEEILGQTNEALHIEQADLFEKLLVGLKPGARLVMWLFIVEGYSHEEISQLTKHSLSYSKSIVSRCTKSIYLSNEESTDANR